MLGRTFELRPAWTSLCNGADRYKQPAWEDLGGQELQVGPLQSFPGTLKLSRGAGDPAGMSLTGPALLNQWLAVLPEPLPSVVKSHTGQPPKRELTGQGRGPGLLRRRAVLSREGPGDRACP